MAYFNSNDEAILILLVPEERSAAVDLGHIRQAGIAVDAK